MLPPVIFIIIQTGNRANGGVESITQIVMRCSVIRPIILTNIDSQHTRRIAEAGIEIHVLPLHYAQSSHWWRRPFTTWTTASSYIHKICRLSQSVGRLIIHANDPIAVQIALLCKWILQDVRITFSIRDTFASDQNISTLKWRIYMSFSDHVFFLSEDMKARWFERIKVLPRASSVTYSIVDNDAFPFSKERVDTVVAPRVLVAGVFREKKGQLNFLKYCAPYLAAEGIDIVLAGDFDPARDVYAAACASAAQPLGGKVRFIGHQSNVFGAIADATLIAVPSTHEGLARIMIEALSVGRPVVSFDVCSAREMLERTTGHGGAVVPIGDNRAMSEAIVRFAQNRGLRQSASAAGRCIAETLLRPNVVMDKYEEVWIALAK